MKQLILLIAGIALSVFQTNAQSVQIDQVDWSTQTPGATSGQSINGEFWLSSGQDQDGTSLFGVNNGVFSFEDIEGSSTCPCTVGDPNPQCGNNDNFLIVGPFLAPSFCEITVSFDVTPRGTLLCGAADDQNPVDFGHSECPSDNGDQWLATDGLEIKILNSSTGEERITLICGTFSESGSFSINETFDVGADGTAIAVTITGGTQNGGSYDIGNVDITGIPRINTQLNTQIITDNDNNVVCEGIGDIIIQTAADPFSQFTWAFPDGSAVSGNRNNGLDVLTLNNIDPTMSGTYRVTVVDDNNCELYDQLDITILPSNSAQCLANLSFSQLFPIQCSTDTLPSEDDNGITGTWIPGNILANFAGQTLNFTFVPDDPAVNSEDRLITVNDLSNFEDFALPPTEIPILCNASDTTFDFIEMFQLNYQDYRLEVSGDLGIFDFIPNNSTVIVDAFVNEFRNIDIKGLSPRRAGFQVVAYADCGAEPKRKSFFVDIIDPAAPIIIDTTLCIGDFVPFGNYKIFGDTVIAGAYDCDTMLIANITKLQPVTTRLFYNKNAACASAIYYYDTIVNGRFVGFVESKLSSPPPHGPNYSERWTRNFSGNYALPFPAKNGCDSLQKMSITFGRTNRTLIEFDLCANLDTTIDVGNNSYLFNKDNTYQYLDIASCTSVEIIATLLPAIADTIPLSTHCASEVVSLEIERGRFMDFDASMPYPYTVQIDQGSNGCPTTVTVDLNFVQPKRDTIFRKLCPGESFSVGAQTFNSTTSFEDVLLSGGAASGCDSIVTVNVEVIVPSNIEIRETICKEDEFDVQGEIFNFGNSSGIVRVPSILGCDSLVYDVEIEFFEVQDSLINPMICPGDEIELTEYNFTIDADNLTADLVGSTSDGCLQNILVRATIDEPILTDFSEIICAGETFMYAGQERSQSGSYPETLIAASGCDSISTLLLTVLDEIPVTDDGDIQVCTGLPVTHLGNTYNIAGPYTETLISKMGCDSIVIFTVSFAPIPTNDIGIFETCPSTPVTILGNDYSEEGSFQDTLSTAFGCDSIVTFEVQYYVIPETDLGILTTCPAVPFDLFGKSYETEGSFSETLQSTDGCDSIVTFELIFDAVPETDLGILTTCPAVPLDLLGNSYATEGSYSETLQTADGCDSIVTFELVFDAVPETDLGILTTCPAVPLDLLGNSYATEGSYSETLQTADGCDSIVTFELVFDAVPETDLGILTTCPAVPLDLFGKSYATEGSFSETLQSTDGCDSIVTFELIFDAVPETDLGILTTCPAVPLDLFGKSYATEGSFSETLQSADGCDSIVIFELVFDAVPETNLGILTTCPAVPIEMFGKSYATEGSYSETLQTADGCDSIVTFELLFDAVPETDLGIMTSCPGVPVEFMGTSYEQAGSFSVTTQSADGCDSTLTFEVVFGQIEEELVVETICPGDQFFVFNNAYAVSTDTILVNPDGSMAGCDTTVHLILTVSEILETEEEFNICPGTSATVGNQTFTTDVSDVPVLFTSAEGCDSTVFVTVNVLPNYDINLGDVQLCGAATLTIGTTVLSDEGPHTVSMTSSSGCDSIVTLNLVRVLEYSQSLELNLCPGEDVTVGSNTYSQSGTYIDTLVSTTGCDSIVTLDLTMLTPIDTTFMDTENLCSGESFDFNGSTYMTSGEHVVNLQSKDGCDSVVVLTIEIFQDVVEEVFAETCEGTPYVFENMSFGSTGIYEVTLQTVNGCDSTRILDLTVIEGYEENKGIVQICTGSSLEIGTNVLTTSDDYSFMFTSKLGCDSIVNVTLEVVNNIQANLGQVYICDGQTYQFGGQDISISGTYRDTVPSSIGCDSITTINIEVIPPLEITINNLIGSCEGGANGSFVIESIPGALPPFFVSGLVGVTEIVSLPFTVSGLAEGDYSFDIIDGNGCMTMGDVTITDDRENALTITSLEVDPTGMYELILEYSGEIESIEWADVEGLSCYDCPNPSVDIEETTTFAVTVVDTEGCVSTAEITLVVDGIGNVYLPNVINPNSAIGNHRFFPQTEASNTAHYDIFVFDRWGNKVYEMLGGPVNDISFGWNGRYSDNRINSGVFVYSVRIYKENGITKTFKGDVTVVE